MLPSCGRYAPVFGTLLGRRLQLFPTRFHQSAARGHLNASPHSNIPDTVLLSVAGKAALDSVVSDVTTKYVHQPNLQPTCCWEMECIANVHIERVGPVLGSRVIVRPSHTVFV